MSTRPQLHGKFQILFLGALLSLTGAIATPAHAQQEERHRDWLQNFRRENANKTAYYWQEGQWFELPLAYINDPILDDNFMEALLDKDRMSVFLSERKGLTGYAENGSYDPGLVSNGKRSGKLNFGFYVGSLRPHSESYLYHPDMSPYGDDTAAIVVLWPGGNSAPEDYAGLYDAYQDEMGPPPPLGTGRFAQIYGGPRPYEESDPSYFIYEQSMTYEVRLHCETKVLQPACHGEMRDVATGTYIRAQFPERIMRSDKSWLNVADPAFKFINSWRQESGNHGE